MITSHTLLIPSSPEMLNRRHVSDYTTIRFRRLKKEKTNEQKKQQISDRTETPTFCSTSAISAIWDSAGDLKDEDISFSIYWNIFIMLASSPAYLWLSREAGVIPSHPFPSSRWWIPDESGGAAFLITLPFSDTFWLWVSNPTRFYATAIKTSSQDAMLSCPVMIHIESWVE